MEILGITADNDGMVGLYLMGMALLLALSKAWQAWRFVRASVPTRGEVVAYEAREFEINTEDGPSTHKRYSQVIRYVDRDGVARTFKGPETASRKRNTIGTSIAIRYHPQQAVPAQVDSIKDLYGQSITLLIIVVVLWVFTLAAS